MAFEIANCFFVNIINLIKDSITPRGYPHLALRQSLRIFFVPAFPFLGILALTANRRLVLIAAFSVFVCGFELDGALREVFEQQ